MTIRNFRRLMDLYAMLSNYDILMHKWAILSPRQFLPVWLLYGPFLFLFLFIRLLRETIWDEDTNTTI